MKFSISKIIAHIAGCLVFLVLPVLFAPGPSSIMAVLKVPPTQRDILTNLLLIVFFYINYFVLIPVLYFSRKYVLFFLIAGSCFFIVALLPLKLIKDRDDYKPKAVMHAITGNTYLQQPPPGAPPEETHRPPPEPDGSAVFETAHRFILFVAILFFSLVLSINNRWKQAEQEKLNAELSYLKAQINPHFLFNTLNTIYALAIEKSDKTAVAVVKLSEMMRYILTESEKDYTLLENELSYIDNYVLLQQIRFGESVRLSYHIEGDVSGKKIAPLLLIPFIENAFKYGINAETDSKIKISIKTNASILNMEVENKKVLVQQNSNESSGIGIGNTKSRLRLLYPGRHLLSINEDTNLFSVKLELQVV